MSMEYKEPAARTIDGVELSGPSWRRDLLSRMANNQQKVHPTVISSDSISALGEFRRSRGFVRNVYTMNLVPEKLARLMDQLPTIWQTGKEELAIFADFSLSKTSQQNA